MHINIAKKFLWEMKLDFRVFISEIKKSCAESVDIAVDNLAF